MKEFIKKINYKKLLIYYVVGGLILILLNSFNVTLFGISAYTFIWVTILFQLYIDESNKKSIKTLNKADIYYFKTLENIVKNGCIDENPRSKYKDGTPAHTKFITQVFEEYDISKGEFPIPTLRNTAIKTGIKEILWIYQHQTNSLDKAHELGISWWDEFNIGDNTIGNRYGHTVKKYDLTNELLDGLKNNPFGRRHMIEMYQYEEIRSSKGLDPCAHLTEWSVRKIDGEYYLDVTLMQRSNDLITAGAINKTQYVALLMMVCGHLDYKPGKFCHFIQNCHIYDRHIDAANEILKRKSLYKQPKMILKENKNFYDYTVDDFEIVDIDGICKIESPLELAI
jgi:thymidylate synthase